MHVPPCWQGILAHSSAIVAQPGPRYPRTQVQTKLLTARRVLKGTSGRGSRGPSLLGVYGQTGAYDAVLKKHLTPSARKEFFKGQRGPWYDLAKKRVSWREFVNNTRI